MQQTATPPAPFLPTDIVRWQVDGQTYEVVGPRGPFYTRVMRRGAVTGFNTPNELLTRVN